MEIVVTNNQWLNQSQMTCRSELRVHPGDYFYVHRNNRWEVHIMHGNGSAPLVTCFMYQYQAREYVYDKNRW